MFRTGLLLFLVLGRMATAATDALPERCLELLRSRNVRLPNMAAWTQQSWLTPATRVELPFKLTPRYDVRLMRLDLALPGVRSVYLSHADRVQVIPIKGHIESWHNLIHTIDGVHFTLGFRDAASRDAFVAADYSRVLVAEGTIRVGDETQYIVALTPERFAETVGTGDDAGYRPSDRAELEILSDSRAQTLGNGSGGTTYYFRSREVIGFRRGRDYFRFAVRPAAAGKASAASHAEILRHQGGAYAPELAKDQFLLGRRYLEEDLSNLRARSSLPPEERARLETDAESKAGSVSIALRSVNYPWAASIPSGIAASTQASMRAFRATLSSCPDPGALNIPDLPEFSGDLRALAIGKAGSEVLVRFIWIRGTSPATADAGFFFSTGALLHDQMARLALGPVLHAEPDLAEAYLRGGLLRVRYSAAGTADAVEVLDAKITLPTGALELAPEEKTALERGVAKVLGN